MNMKRCCIFSNCQADGLAHFLRKAVFPYHIETFLNYQLILGEQSPVALTESAARCDLFIYQPTREQKHGPLSSEYYVERVIPKSARSLSFPYLFNHGLFPLVGHGDGFMGAAEMPEELWRLPVSELLHRYDRGEVDFALWPRFLACAAEQARREQQCDVRLSPWIVDHRHVQSFLNFNHPASALFAELAREVMGLVLGVEVGPIRVDHINEASLPCDLPLSQYVIDEFDMRVPANPHAHAHYRTLLERAWQQKQLSAAPALPPGQSNV